MNKSLLQMEHQKTPSAATNYQRALYNWIKRDPNSPYKRNVIEESVLRSPVVLGDGQNQFRFPIKETDQRDALAVGLKQNDVFYISNWNIHLRKRVYVDNTKSAIKWNSIPYTWANSFVFAGAGTAHESIRNIFTVGLYNMIVGSTKFMENYPIERFMKVPELSKGVSVSEVVQTGQILEDPFNDDQIFIENIPALALIGADSIECMIDINGINALGLEMSADRADEDYIVELEFRGILIKDGAHLAKAGR
jgi:hypothetical protein